MQYIGYVIIVILVVIVLWMVFKSRKARWYKVERADNRWLLLHRSGGELWGSSGDVLRFRNEYGHVVKIHWHWVLALEEIPDNEVETVKEEIKRWNGALAKEE